MSAAATLATLLGSHLNAVPSFGKSQSANAEDEAESQPVRPAAVLVPVLPRGNDVTLLFTQRAPDLAYHASQVSFPGGQVELLSFRVIECILGNDAVKFIFVLQHCISPL